MKIILVLLCLTIGFSCNCWGQDTIQKSIPMLKESAKVDSFIMHIINIPDKEKASKDDSCLLLNLTYHSSANFIQGLYALNNRRTIFGFADFENDGNVGYFEFKKYLIFVYGDKYLKQFFKPTNVKRQFNFIKMNTTNFFPMIKGYLSWAVFYDDKTLNYGVH